MVKKPRVQRWLKKVNIVAPYCKAQVCFLRRLPSGQTINYHAHDTQFKLSKVEVYSVEAMAKYYETWYDRLPDEEPYIQLFFPRFCPEDYHYVNPSGKHGIQIMRWEKYLELRGIEGLSCFKFKFSN